MMLSFLNMIFSLGLPVVAAQETGSSLEEVIRRYEKGILRFEGVKEIVPDQVNGKSVITVRVETSEARDMVLLVTQEKLETYPLRVLLSKTPLPSRPGASPPEPKDPPAQPVCERCAIHCPKPPAAKSDEEEGGSKEKPPATPPSDPKKKSEAVCAHCPEHCVHAEAPATVAEPKAPLLPQPPPGKVEPAPEADPRCDVARKLRGLPPFKSGRLGCEEMLSTSNNPDTIRWAIEKTLPHWISKEMPGVKGNGRDGISCPTHGTHSTSEFVCYSWVKHGRSCPMKDILSPKDLAPPAKKGSE